MAVASIYDVLTPAWVRATYLAGVDLTDDLGTSFADETVLIGLRQAIAQIEQRLSITIDTIRVTNERHDLYTDGRWTYWPFYLNHSPLQKINDFRAKYGQVLNQPIPVSWLTLVSKDHSRLNVTPSNEQIQQMASMLGTPFIFWNSGYAPGFFVFDYTAGFQVFTNTTSFNIGETSKVVAFAADETFESSEYYSVFSLVSPNPADASIVPVSVQRTLTGMTIQLSRAPVAPLTVRWYLTDIPDNLRHLIGMMAAIHPLTIAGDLVLGAGVTSRSIGIDGLSQSVSTTKSGAQGGAFAARIKSYNEEGEKTFEALRGRYKLLSVSAF
jgi:hypothetical protein